MKESHTTVKFKVRAINTCQHIVLQTTHFRLKLSASL